MVMTGRVYVCFVLVVYMIILSGCGTTVPMSPTQRDRAARFDSFWNDVRKSIPIPGRRWGALE